MLKLTEILKEEIAAREAYNDESAIQTVADGKRNIGWIALKSAVIPEDLFWKLVEDNNLGTLRVPSNPYEVYIYYRRGAENQAEELKKVAEKYGGYLAYDATEEDSRKIGQLLGYKDEDIDDYIQHNKKQRGL